MTNICADSVYYICFFIYLLFYLYYNIIVTVLRLKFNSGCDKMIFKKINAVLALLICLLLADHTIVCSIRLLTKDFSKDIAKPAYALMVLVAIHIIMSLIFVFVKHDSKFIKYTKKNVRTIIQRDSGFLMVAVTPIHVYSVMTISNGNFTLFYISHLLLVLFSMLHMAVSVPNALVTLGIITSTKQQKIALYISSLISFLLFLLGAAVSIWR